MTKKTHPSKHLLLSALLSLPTLTKEQRNKISRLSMNNIDTLPLLFDRHRIWSCAYINIQSCCSSSFPKGYIEYLKKKHYDNIELAKNQFHTHCQVIQSFKYENVPFYTLKGIPLTNKLYGDLTKRFDNDIDILIPFEHFTKSQELLLELGFKAKFYDNLTDFQKSQYFDTFKDVTYIKNDTNVVLELHIRPCEHVTKLSTNINKALLNGEVQDSAGEIVYLCWHGTHTLFYRLKWLLDIALYLDRFISNNTSPEQELIKRAQELDELRSLVISWVLAHEIYNIKIPPKIKLIYKKDKISQWIHKHCLKALNAQHSISSIQYRFEVFICEILLAKSWATKWRYLIFQFRPKISDFKDFNIIPTGMLFLFWLIKPLRIILYQLPSKLLLSFKTGQNLFTKD